MKLFLLVLSLITTFSSARPKFSLVEVENKEGHRQEDEGLAQDQLVVGGQSHDDRDYRMVMILFLLLYGVHFYLHFRDALLYNETFPNNKTLLVNKTPIRLLRHQSPTLEVF